MILSEFAPRPDLTAAAYLLEIIIAEFLFLGPYKKKGRFAARAVLSHLGILLPAWPALPPSTSPTSAP